MNTPKISEIKATADGLIAVIEGQDVKLVTFRETLWEQGKVMLPDPLAARCPTLSLFVDWRDDESNLQPVAGCIHDLWAADLMKEWANDRLKMGTYRRK